MIRVGIVSPIHALRAGLKGMLGSQPGLNVVSEAVNLEQVNEQETEVLVVASVSVLHLAGLQAESLGILLLTEDVEAARGFLGSNVHAWGVLSPEASAEELTAAIKAVGQGLWVGAPGLLRGLMPPSRGALPGGEDAPVEKLTAREMEILQWMAEGLANKQIALKLGISEHTVKFHLSSLYAKFNVSSRTEAVRRGLELGLITL